MNQRPTGGGIPSTVAPPKPQKAPTPEPAYSSKLLEESDFMDRERLAGNE